MARSNCSMAIETYGWCKKLSRPALTEQEREDWARELRPKVQARKDLHELSERELARQVGVSAPTVSDFLKENGVPQQSTLESFHRWMDTRVSRTVPIVAEVTPESVVVGGPHLQAMYETLVESREALYAALTRMGGPGEAADDKLALIELLGKAVAHARGRGVKLPTEYLVEAHQDVLNGDL